MFFFSPAKPSVVFLCTWCKHAVKRHSVILGFRDRSGRDWKTLLCGTSFKLCGMAHILVGASVWGFRKRDCSPSTACCRMGVFKQLPWYLYLIGAERTFDSVTMSSYAVGQHIVCRQAEWIHGFWQFIPCCSFNLMRFDECTAQHSQTEWLFILEDEHVKVPYWMLINDTVSSIMAQCTHLPAGCLA